ncbi:hypothetical protein J8I87_42420, partial [Paraburkholderia sp. LEh10]|uniref:hypothetical protein n=1 Tax=Paraburkholderia sp. LEh10 TaxID=2821353 RepID=UPI001AE78DEC
IQLSGIVFSLHARITHHALFGAHVSKKAPISIAYCFSFSKKCPSARIPPALPIIGPTIIAAISQES